MKENEAKAQLRSCSSMDTARDKKTEGSKKEEEERKQSAQFGEKIKVIRD